MKKFLDLIGFTTTDDYRNRMLYYMIGSCILVAGFFLGLYLLYAPFWPAITVHILYVSLHISLLFFAKNKRYAFVRYSLITAHMIQLTLAVYVWFPYTTGYGIFYFMVPLTSFIIMDYGIKSQRLFAIISSLISALLFLLSEVIPIDFYLYELPSGLTTFIRGTSIVSILIPMTFIFTQFAQSQYKTNKELNFLANTDALTQILNRRVLFQKGEETYQLASKYHFDFATLLFDIDFFKQINDQYGHPVGDIILKELTELVSNNIRKADTFSRYGGEEFAIILHKVSPGESFVIAEQLLELVRNHVFRVDGHTISLTVSMGIVNYSSKFRAFDHMMKAADRALYQAKNNGRNQLVIG